MTPITHNSYGIPTLSRHLQNCFSSPVTRVALSALSVLGIVLSFVAKMPLLAIIPAGYLLYQAFRWLDCDSDSVERILIAAAEGFSEYSANQPVYSGLRGGSYRGQHPYPQPRPPVDNSHIRPPVWSRPNEEHVQVGRGHTDTPDRAPVFREEPQTGPRAPVGRGHTNTPAEELAPRGRSQTGPRAPVGRGHTNTPAEELAPRGRSQMGQRAPVGGGHRPPGEDPEATRRTIGHQEEPRAPVGH